MGNVLPRWSLIKSVVCWTVVLVFVIFSLAALVESVSPYMRPMGEMLELIVQLAGYAWLTSLIGTAPLHQLLLHGTNIEHLVKSNVLQPSLLLPAGTGRAEIASTVLAVLLFTIGIDTARRLRKATVTEAPGIDVVATHDLVAATMFQLTAAERLRRVGQCGSLLLDHTSYLHNAWSVLPLIAEQIEHASGLRPLPSANQVGQTPSRGERYHHARLTMDAWTRPLVSTAILALSGWFMHDRVAPAAWIGAGIFCGAIAWITITCASARRLNRSSLLAANEMATTHKTPQGSGNHWHAVLALMATPLLGGAALAFTTPSMLHSLEHHPTSVALTVAAFPIGVALCVVSWRSLFGVQRESVTALVLVSAAAVWLLRGTIESTMMAVLMLALAAWAYRRHVTTLGL